MMPSAASQTRASAAARQARRKLMVRAWHWRIGFAVLPVVVLLVVTGIAINHSEPLGLDRRYADNPWLLSWYGIAPASEPVAFAAGGRELGWLDGTLFVDGTAVTDAVSGLRGAASADGLLVAVSGDAIYLLTPEGVLVEKLDTIGLPAAIDAVAAADGGGIAVLSDGRVFLGDGDATVWEEADLPRDWARARAPTPALGAAMRAHVIGRGLTWERILLDLHSGRLFGRLGPLFVDAVALLLLALAASGLYNRLRRG